MLLRKPGSMCNKLVKIRPKHLIDYDRKVEIEGPRSEMKSKLTECRELLPRYHIEDSSKQNF